MPAVFAIDQGTTGSKAYRLDSTGKFERVGGFDHRQIYPQPGWVEHDPLELLGHLRQLLERAGATLSEGLVRRGPAAFSDVLSDALLFPLNVSDEAEIAARVREGVQQYFEETWIHRPLNSLSHVPPIDAAGHAVLPWLNSKAKWADDDVVCCGMRTHASSRKTWGVVSPFRVTGTVLCAM